MTIWLIETFVWAKATWAPDRRQRTATKTAKRHSKFILVCFMTTLSICQRDQCSFVIFNPRRSHATHRDRNSAGKTTSGLGFVANHFDVVPVRTNDESCIVVRVVFQAQTRRTIVFATRLQSRAIESFHLLAILGGERQVKMRRLLLGLVQAQ